MLYDLHSLQPRGCSPLGLVLYKPYSTDCHAISTTYNYLVVKLLLNFIALPGGIQHTSTVCCLEALVRVLSAATQQCHLWDIHTKYGMNMNATIDKLVEISSFWYINTYVYWTWGAQPQGWGLYKPYSMQLPCYIYNIHTHIYIYIYILYVRTYDIDILFHFQSHSLFPSKDSVQSGNGTRLHTRSCTRAMTAYDWSHPWVWRATLASELQLYKTFFRAEEGTATQLPVSLVQSMAIPPLRWSERCRILSHLLDGIQPQE